MAQDLTIRLLGRPKVTQDSQLGFQRIVRKYVVQGPRASKAGIEDANNPLFLPVGTADEEFTDHYLVNQAVEPTSSMDQNSEAKVVSSLEEECADKTMVVVTHRNPILKMVDRVFMFENGSIVADRTPEQLGIKKG